MVSKVCAKQPGAPLLYLGERIRWLPLTTFRTQGVTGSSPATEASPELLMPLKVELCRAAPGMLTAAVAGSRLLQAHSLPTMDEAGWPHCRLGAVMQSLALPLRARARRRSSMQALMPGLQDKSYHRRRCYQLASAKCCSCVLELCFTQHSFHFCPVLIHPVDRNCTEKAIYTCTSKQSVTAYALYSP